MQLSPSRFFGIITAFTAITVFVVLVDIPVVRPVFSFVFLAFVPGLLILHIFKLDRLGFSEKLVITVGLSVAFIMIFGLILNSLLLAVGYEKPLALIPLLISLGGAALLLAVVAYLRNKNHTFTFHRLQLSIREKCILLVPSLLPLLSISGTYIMNLRDNNIILLLLLSLIPLYVIVISIFHNRVPVRLYPGIILLISISLLLILSLRSNHLVGSDTHLEYFAFMSTNASASWHILRLGVIDACLSISVLPSVFQTFMAINPEYIFKIIYSLLFSVSPLIIYIVTRKYFADRYSFLATFFFMSQVSFLETSGSARMVIAILFYMLTIMVIFHNNLYGISKKNLLLIFAVSVILSHYSTSYVFLFLMILAWLGTPLVFKMLSLRSHNTVEVTVSKSGSEAGPIKAMGSISATKPSKAHTPMPTRKITFTAIFLFLAIIFFWYNSIAFAPFSVSLGVVYESLSSLGNWFVVEAKGPTITSALGTDINTTPQLIRFAVSWIIIAVVVIGMANTLFNHRKQIAVFGPGDSKPGFLKNKLELEFYVLSLACVLFGGLAIIASYLSIAYSIENASFIMVIILSPFIIIGVIKLAGWLRMNMLWLILPLLTLLFMSTTGTLYQVFGVPAALTLNSKGVAYDSVYVHDYDSSAAWWLKEYGGNVDLYCASTSRFFSSQGLIHPSRLYSYDITEYHGESINVNGYFYRRYTEAMINSLENRYPNMFNTKNKIYSNTASTVYR